MTKNSARDERVRRANEELLARGLPALFSHAGDSGNGEDELVELVSVTVNRHYAALHLRTRLPSGAAGDYIVEMNVQLLRWMLETGKRERIEAWLAGIIIVPTVTIPGEETLLVMSQQGRITQQGMPRANELPRSFFFPGDGFPSRAAINVRGGNPVWWFEEDLRWQRAPIGGTRSKLQPLLDAGRLAPSTFQILGVVAEDTGRSLNQVVVAHLDFKAEPGFADVVGRTPKSRKWKSATGIEGRLFLHPLRQLLWDPAYRREHGGRDVHTAAGLDAFLREVALPNMAVYGPSVP